MLFRGASLLAIVALFSLTLHAKDTSENKVKFNAKFKTFSFEGNIPDIVFQDNKEYKPIEIFDCILCTEKIYTGGPVIEFFKVVIEKPPTDSEIAKRLPRLKYEPIAKFPIPTSGGNYILIFNKTPNGVTISPLNDAPGLFPFGSYQFFNLTGATVELRFGSKVIPLSPNARTVFKPETANGEYLEGEFWTKVDDEFKLGYKFRNLHINRIRTLAFIMPTAPGQSALNLKIAEERGQIEPPPPPENPKDKGEKTKESEKKEAENKPFG